MSLMRLSSELDPGKPCADCGGPTSDLFAAAFAKHEMKQGRSVNRLCAACAGSRTGKRIAAEFFAKRTPENAD